METKFTVVSAAKQFTAFAIMILHDKGLLQLDDKPVSAPGHAASFGNNRSSTFIAYIGTA